MTCWSARLSWRQRRSSKLALIWLALASAGAIAPFAGSWLKALGLAGLDPHAAHDALVEAAGARGAFVAVPGLRDWLAAHSNFMIALAGFVVFGLPMTKGRFWIHDRFFASFNDNVLTRVSSLHRPDRDPGDEIHFVTLPWVLGKTGARRAA